MKIQSLSGAWEFRQADADDWFPASVPGGAHTDLLSLGHIPDPFVGDNEKRVQWVADADWTYRHAFSCPVELLALERIFLVCEGLDTLATVALNGHVLGSTDNMFRKYAWEVTALLNSGGVNKLVVDFKSAVKYVEEKQAIRTLAGVTQAIPGSPHLRKAPCQFGWDWGPQLPPVGIWKDIRLEGYSSARFSEIHLQQDHNKESVTIKVLGEIESWDTTPVVVRVNVTTPEGEVLEGTVLPDRRNFKVDLPIPNPQLWWPNGYGEQPLYQVEVSLFADDASAENLLDQSTYQVGLRTLELLQEEDQWGRSFVFIVNGTRIMCKGSNWIPADSFPTRISDENLEYLIRSAAETHQNMLRVWGGGFYEEERFYDLCDRYGILVWQDFIFSCSIYPLDDPDFVENVRQEAVDNIRRIRHRASLALWCGNNEMEWGWVDWGWNQPELQDLKTVYDEFFHHTLPAWCQSEDPHTPYWPSSPSSDTPFDDPNGQQQGDAHYWDVWHGRKPFTAYRDQYPRFMSEFGFQALPPLATISTYAAKDDWNMTSYIMEQHQKNDSGNALMVGQMLDTFRLPKDFASLVYLSLALQAEGIRYGVEHWRRYPEQVAGILYWQLNDCWPVASWSSLDYFGRWKALHYAARRFYTPVLLSIEDNPPQQSVFISNDSLNSWEGTVKWFLETLTGELISSGEEAAEIPPQSSRTICELEFSDQITEDNRRGRVFIAELWQGEHLVTRQTALFAPVKHLSLTNPQINADLEVRDRDLFINLESVSLALMVEVSLDGADTIFSDNYFSLPPGRSVQITCPLPEGWNVSNAQEALKIFSVFDSYTNPPA